MKRDSRKEMIEDPGEWIRANLGFKILVMIRRPLKQEISNRIGSELMFYCVAIDKGVEEEVCRKVFSPVAGATIDELVNYESK